MKQNLKHSPRTEHILIINMLYLFNFYDFFVNIFVSEETNSFFLSFFNISKLSIEWNNKVKNDESSESTGVPLNAARKSKRKIVAFLEREWWNNNIVECEKAAGKIDRGSRHLKKNVSKLIDFQMLRDCFYDISFKYNSIDL